MKLFKRAKKYSHKFNYERYSEWVKCSIGWMSQDEHGVLMSRVQGLGIIDAELYDISSKDVKSDLELENGMTVFSIVNIKSYLWVLGVYEFFRMFDQKISENPSLADEKASSHITKAKKEFARLRVPLAKLEPSGKYKNVDYAIPIIGGNDIQIGWQINDNDIIWYRDLSDLALEALVQMRIFRLNKNLNNEI